MNNRIYKCIGRNIQKRMRQLGLYDFQGADALGKDRKTVAYWRHSTCDIKLSDAKRLCNFLGMELDDLFKK